MISRLGLSLASLRDRCLHLSFNRFWIPLPGLSLAFPAFLTSQPIGLTSSTGFLLLLISGTRFCFRFFPELSRGWLLMHKTTSVASLRHLCPLIDLISLSFGQRLLWPSNSAFALEMWYDAMVCAVNLRKFSVSRCYVIRCAVKRCYVTQCHAMLCYEMLCYKMLCDTMLDYKILIYKILLEDLMLDDVMLQDVTKSTRYML